MNRRESDLLRQLMAFLAVLAAFVFQLRMEALGGLSNEPVTAAQLRVMLAEGSHCGEHRHSSSSHQQTTTTPTQHRHTSSRSDPHEGHQAHCPFCVTNAFALEAGIIGLPQGPPDFLAQPVRSASFCVVAPVSHADARAPPFFL